METIKERLRPAAASVEKEILGSKIIVFPREDKSMFRNRQDELSYCISSVIRDEESALFDSVLE